ncbi:hypothetical protein V7S43_005430 [Phytophthora oleae]|uniref:Uncharacterized protein n=1 Tax=Phytophthora oleae TaxID=2107226 RepID=A0ABD3FRT7_9STRA
MDADQKGMMAEVLGNLLFASDIRGPRYACYVATARAATVSRYMKRVKDISAEHMDFTAIYENN